MNHFVTTKQNLSILLVLCHPSANSMPSAYLVFFWEYPALSRIMLGLRIIFRLILIFHWLNCKFFLFYLKIQGKPIGYPSWWSMSSVCGFQVCFFYQFPASMSKRARRYPQRKIRYSSRAHCLFLCCCCDYISLQKCWENNLAGNSGRTQLGSDK